MNIGSHNGTRVEFLSKWFQTMEEHDAITGRTTPLEIVQSLLLDSVAADPELTRDFQDMTGRTTGDDDHDIVEMRDIIISKASLYDGKDASLASLLPLSRRMAHVTDGSYTANEGNNDTYSHGNEDSLDGATNLNIYRSNRGNLNARLPQEVYSKLNNDGKEAWRSLPSETRSVISDALNKTKDNTYNAQDSRSTHMHNTVQTEDMTKFSELTDNNIDGRKINCTSRQELPSTTNGSSLHKNCNNNKPKRSEMEGL